MATSARFASTCEPTTGLDASVAAGVLDLLRGLLAEREVAAVVVSHDAVIEALLAGPQAGCAPGLPSSTTHEVSVVAGAVMSAAEATTR